MEFMDIFNDDAFSLTTMVSTVNEIDHVPGRAGSLCFAGVGSGVATTSVVIESKGTALSVVPTSPRGAPAPQEQQDKANLRKIAEIPQVKLEETIGAHQIQGVREFGSPDVLKGAQSVVRSQQNKMTQRLDLTLEYHRLGALKGYVRDANGSVLLDLYDAFGISVPGTLDWSFLNDGGVEPSGDATTVRDACQAIKRIMQRTAKMVLPSSARIWAFCGDEFFDKVQRHWSVKEAFRNTSNAGRLLENNAFSAVDFGTGVIFENYQGTDDVTGEEASDGELYGSVGIASNEARIFLTGVPGLYAEYFAPADFFDAVNTIGLPRYSRLAVDRDMQRWIKVHVQQNPLPICLRPQTLLRATAA